VKRKTRAFLERAMASLVLAIELFNRPSDSGRVEAVVILLDHALEMLLKATVFEKTGRIREKRAIYNYGFDKCINICESQLGVVDKNESLVLRNLNGFRDAAQHDILILGERLLYAHAQSAVATLSSLLEKVFNIKLAGYLPSRVLPISVLPPVEMHVLVSEDMDTVRTLLSAGHRRRSEAEARLRAYAVMEKNLRELHGAGGSTASVERLAKSFGQRDWTALLPMVAGLVQTSPDGIPISLRVSRQEGFPVRVDPSSPTAIAFKYVKPEDTWPFLTDELAQKLGIGRNYLLGVVKLLGLKGRDEYHIAIKSSRTSSVQRYSGKAYQVLQKAIDIDGLEILWQAAKRGESRDPDEYLETTASTRVTS
jgi:hypothetical protein